MSEQRYKREGILAESSPTRGYLIKNALIPILEDEKLEGRYGYERVDLRIRGSTIEEVEAAGTLQASDGEESVDGTNGLVLPGFVNAHTHSSEIWARGEIDMMPLELWLAQLVDWTPNDAHQVYLSCLHNGVETLLSGGTSVTDHISPIVTSDGVKHIYQTVECAVRAYRKLGIRAFIAPLMGDLQFTDVYPTPPGAAPRSYEAKGTAHLLEELERAIVDFHCPEEGITVMVGPTGIQLCSDELLRGCALLSEKYGVPRHIHCLETRAQQQLALEKYGKTAVEHLRDLGYLGPNTSCAHCIWLSDGDIEIFRETGTTAVHNALSNLRLGSGIAPVLKYVARGVNVAIGCDGSASNDSQDMLEAVKIGMMLHNVTEPDYRLWLKPYQAVRMASQGGARGLGVGDRLGAIRKGMLADLVLYDLTQTCVLPRTDPLGLLIMGRASGVARDVWVHGVPVVRKCAPLGLDLDWLRSEMLRLSDWKLTPRDSPLLDLLQPKYRSSMGLKE